MENQESFRDSIGTINEEGKRQWIYPKKPNGIFYTYRKYVSYVLLAFLFLAPFIKVNGNQFMLINILERRFNVFGYPFWPQDFYIFVIALVIFFVFVSLFTVAFGRIFCGWLCPQTVFMEMVFRRIEYAIEGDRNKQIRLSKLPWNTEKITKRVSKWIIFFLISFIISNVFLAYLIGSDKLLMYIKDGPFEHLGTFIPLLFFTGVFYFVYAWFREQACLIVCPYGRLQGALLDDKSVVVAYDYKRGEGEAGRKKFRKNEDRDALGHGDCIDCKQCVFVCPTGIDIRNGTQMECVNCTACIDECDTIMETINKPKGLIRYASEENIAKKKPFTFTTRMKGYAAVLTILVGVLVSLLFLRSDVEAVVLRLPGQLFEHKENNIISNVYTFKLINKTTREYENLEFKLHSHQGKINLVGGENAKVPPQDLIEGTMFIEIESGLLDGHKNRLIIGVYSNGELIETTRTNFLGPRGFN